LNSTAGATILINVADTAERIVCQMWCLDVRTGSPNGGAGAVNSGSEFVVLSLPVFFKTSQHQF